MPILGPWRPGPPERRPAKAAAARRRKREAEIIAATRALFDQRGVRDAQIEDIAQAVGINRAIVYRHFTGKEELSRSPWSSYLDELARALAAAADATTDPRRQARRASSGRSSTTASRTPPSSTAPRP